MVVSLFVPNLLKMPSISLSLLKSFVILFYVMNRSNIFDNLKLNLQFQILVQVEGSFLNPEFLNKKLLFAVSETT